ncbi:MAG: GNAT family N-acetyltransferase [Gammaproteobacteria bacterium]
MNYQISSPSTEKEWNAYYDLRWEILRKPWYQPKGSEKDELEDSSIHKIILNQDDQILASGRIHFTGKNTAQIRYMAVLPEYRDMGLGTMILNALEEEALKHIAREIILHARESAVAFYEKHGYKIEKASHLLYGDIQHFLMKKKL